MADEITIRFRVAEPAEALRARWRDAPPGFIASHGYDLVDESYQSLVYARDHSKVTKLLTWGMAKTTYRLSLTFVADGAFGTFVTVTGQAPEPARAEVSQLAAEYGGGADPRLGAQHRPGLRT